jgi:hypothetical protein
MKGERLMGFTDEVITITPSGQFLTFKSEENARCILLKQFHKEIINSPQALAQRYTLERLQHMVKLLNLSDNDLHDTMKIKDKYDLAQRIWLPAIATGRLTTKLVYNKETINPDKPTFTTYYSDYIPGKDEICDMSYVKAAKQEKIIIDMITEKLTPCGKHGTPDYMFYQWIEECDIKTRQSKMLVFNFYKSKLIATGFLEMYVPQIQRRYK